MEFRKMGMQDLPAMSSFIKEAWKQGGPGAPGWAGATQEDIAEISSLPFLSDLASNPDDDVFIAKNGEDIVGMAVSKMMEEGTVELSGIMVLQSHMGEGFGSGLFMMAEGAAMRRGARRMTVKTEAENVRALAFYRSKGFKEVGTGPEKVGKAEVRLTRLMKEL